MKGERRRARQIGPPKGGMLWHRAMVLGLLALLTLGGVAFQNLHVHSPEEGANVAGEGCTHGSVPHDHAEQGDHGDRVADGDGKGCPQDGERGHRPQDCGICKQLHLANQLMLGSSAPTLLVEFVEGSDGRLIAVIRDNRPSLATAPPRGPPAEDL